MVPDGFPFFVPRKARPVGRPVAPEVGHFSDRASVIEDSVFGTLDGVVTSLALVVSVAGIIPLTLPQEITPNYYRIVFLTVVAATVAGSISMFVGALLGARARDTLVRKERQREEREIVEKPDEEREEVRQIFRARGFSESEIEILLRRITADPRLWVDTMMRDELGLFPEADPSPLRHSAVIGLSYLVGGILPALPFVTAAVPIFREMGISVGIAAAQLVVVGILQAQYADTSRLRGAAEIVLAGLGTACAVFLVTWGLQILQV